MEEIAMHVQDIVENSIGAQAKTIRIAIDEDSGANRLSLEIDDDGAGMSDAMLEKVLNPFFTTRTTRRIGLGLPLLKQAAEAAGGSCEIASSEGTGTRVRAWFKYDHVDRQPIGDMVETLKILILCHPAIRFIYEHKVEGELLRLDTQELSAT